MRQRRVSADVPPQREGLTRNKGLTAATQIFNKIADEAKQFYASVNDVSQLYSESKRALSVGKQGAAAGIKTEPIAGAAQQNGGANAGPALTPQALAQRANNNSSNASNDRRSNNGNIGSNSGLIGNITSMNSTGSAGSGMTNMNNMNNGMNNGMSNMNTANNTNNTSNPNDMNQYQEEPSAFNDSFHLGGGFTQDEPIVMDDSMSFVQF